MTRRRTDEGGAAVLEFSLVFPLVVLAIGIAFFTAYIYEVRSDLQRAAQRAANYAATQCDPIGHQAESCKEAANNDHPFGDDVAAHATTRFRDGDVAFTYQADGTCDGRPEICVVYRAPDALEADPPLDRPEANAQVEVTLTYEENSPFTPFLKVVGLSGLVNLTGHGEATVE